MKQAENIIWWHVYPLGALGAPIREGDRTLTHRLPQLTGWLDYASQMGATGLLLGPIFHSETHGYDTLNQFEIDPRLGTEKDFIDFLSAAKNKGMKVILDGVFSHVGSGDPRVLEAMGEGRNSQHVELFDIDWDNPEGPTPEVFEGHGSLIRLNHHSHQAKDYTVAVMNHWLELGIDGWRLDAAYSVDSSFWREVLDEVRAQHPNAWFLGEVIHGDYEQFVNSSTIDTVTQYQLWKAIWSSIKDQNLFELDWALKQHNEMLDHFTPNTFIGNHDVNRIATTVGEDGARLALAVLLTVGGTPSLYYGDEQGYHGVKEERIGGDDQVRPALPASPAEFSELGARTWNTYRALTHLRNTNPWLTHAKTHTLALENKRYSYRTQQIDGDQFIDVEVNLEGTSEAAIRDKNGNLIWHS